LSVKASDDNIELVVRCIGHDKHGDSNP
jgi:hypothetical protein